MLYKKYSIRHKILEKLTLTRDSLFQAHGPYNKFYGVEYAFSSNEIAKSINEITEDVSKQLSVLAKEGYIESSLEDDIFVFYIIEKGALAFYNEFFLETKHNIIRNYIKENISIISSIIALFISTTTFVLTRCDQKDELKKLKNIEINIDSIKLFRKI